MSRVDQIWGILISCHGCKPKKEDCTFQKCNNWGECDFLAQALADSEAERVKALLEVLKNALAMFQVLSLPRMDNNVASNKQILEAMENSFKQAIKTYAEGEI